MSMFSSILGLGKVPLIWAVLDVEPFVPSNIVASLTMTLSESLIIINNGEVQTCVVLSIFVVVDRKEGD